LNAGRSDFYSNRRLLYARRERPRGRRAAEQSDKLAAFHHSITSSARPVRGLDIDSQLDFSGLHDRQVGWPLAF
jgi:hypothetical protein